MKNVIANICLVLAALPVMILPSLAQAQNCAVDQEAIFKLRNPDLGAYALWDSVNGRETDDDRYAAGAVMDNSHLYVAGTREIIAKPYPELILSEIDQRGRVMWETKRVVKGLDSILSVLRTGDDFLVTAMVKEGAITSIWFGFFDLKGALRQERVLKHSAGSFVFADITASADGKGFVMAASVEGKKPVQSRYSEFYRLNSKGQIVSKRAFNPGPDNGLYKIIVSQKGDYLAAGYVNNARGRKTGWLLRVDSKGGIVWQRQYPRGIGAELKHIAEMDNDQIIAFGTALPAQEDALKAGWLMQLDQNNGEMVWQRYFTSDQDYMGRDLLVNADNVITVLLDSKPVKGSFQEEGQVVKDYVRLVTLNPRGVIFDSQAYFQGEIADAQSLVLNNAGDRIIIGAAQIAYYQKTDGQENVEKPIEKRHYKGWVVATPRAEPYIDPCKPKKERVLNSL